MQREVQKKSRLLLYHPSCVKLTHYENSFNVCLDCRMRRLAGVTSRMAKAWCCRHSSIKSRSRVGIHQRHQLALCGQSTQLHHRLHFHCHGRRLVRPPLPPSVPPRPTLRSRISASRAVFALHFARTPRDRLSGGLYAGSPKCDLPRLPCALHT